MAVCIQRQRQAVATETTGGHKASGSYHLSYRTWATGLDPIYSSHFPWFPNTRSQENGNMALLFVLASPPLTLYAFHLFSLHPPWAMPATGPSFSQSPGQSFTTWFLPCQTQPSGPLGSAWAWTCLLKFYLFFRIADLNQSLLVTPALTEPLAPRKHPIIVHRGNADLMGHALSGLSSQHPAWLWVTVSKRMLNWWIDFPSRCPKCLSLSVTQSPQIY